jgi:hypothetical protein
MFHDTLADPLGPLAENVQVALGPVDRLVDAVEVAHRLASAGDADVGVESGSLDGQGQPLLIE